jgi:hypothetical protein
MAAVGKLNPDFRDRVKLKVGSVDTPTLAPSDEAVDLCVESGLTNYSNIRPLVKVFQKAGSNTTKRYVIGTEITDWDDDFSMISYISGVTDPDTDDESESVVDDDEWYTKLSTSDGVVLFLNTVIGSTRTMRIEYTTPHIIHSSDAALTTVPNHDTDLLTAICASQVCFWIARKASDLMNVSLGVSEIDYRRLRSHWSDRAKELASEASEYVSNRTLKPSGGVAVQWESDSRISTGGRRISH